MSMMEPQKEYLGLEPQPTYAQDQQENYQELPEAKLIPTHPVRDFIREHWATGLWIIAACLGLALSFYHQNQVDGWMLIFRFVSLVAVLAILLITKSKSNVYVKEARGWLVFIGSVMIILAGCSILINLFTLVGFNLLLGILACFTVLLIGAKLVGDNETESRNRKKSWTRHFS